MKFSSIYSPSLLTCLICCHLICSPVPVHRGSLNEAECFRAQLTRPCGEMTTVVELLIVPAILTLWGMWSMCLICSALV